MTRNKKRYEQLGYNYTGVNTEFEVKLADLEKKSTRKVKVQCDKCGTEIITPYRNYNKIVENKGFYLCRKCNAPLTSDIRRKNNKERQLAYFEEKTAEKGYKSIAKVSDYKGCDTKMPFICPKHGLQHLSISQLRQGCSCPNCRTSANKLSKDEIKDRIFQKNGDILLNPQDYINSRVANLKIKCGICGNNFITSFASICVSNGYCPECAIKSTTSHSILSKDVIIKNTTRNGICYLLSPNDYINSCVKNLKFICEECGQPFTLDYSHYKNGQIRCRKCTTKIKSLGEYIIIKFLDAHNIEYIQQYRINECRYKKPLPFDFYLPKYNLLIEFDGWQHYNMISKDTQESFQLRKKRDRIKTEYCRDNNIELLRISYLERDNLEKILKKRLNII